MVSWIAIPVLLSLGTVLGFILAALCKASGRQSDVEDADRPTPENIKAAQVIARSDYCFDVECRDCPWAEAGLGHGSFLDEAGGVPVGAMSSAAREWLAEHGIPEDAT
jgi:hypothetical protein